jgi:pectate lyase
MTDWTEAMWRRAMNPFVVGLGAALIATLPFTADASAQCVPTWDDEFVDVGVNQGGLVFSFVEFDDGSGKSLYAGGFFSNIDGVPVSSFARWDGEEWHPLAIGFTDSSINALAVYDDGRGPAIYAGGPFTSIGGVSAEHIARYDHVNNTWEPVGGGLSYAVEDLIVHDDGSGPELYAIGNAQQGSLLIAGVEKWNGTEWTEIGADAGLRGARTATILNGELYVGGTRTLSGPSVERWDGNSWSHVGTSIGFSNLLSLTTFDGTLYAGTFCPSGSDMSDCVFRWEGGTTWTGVAGTTPFIVEAGAPGISIRALGVANDGTGPALYAGGRFTSWSPIATNIAKWDGTDWSPLSFGVYTLSSGNVTGAVFDIYGYNDGTGPGVYVGGSFNQGETPEDGSFLSRGLARWGCFGIVADPIESQLLTSANIISSYGGQATITVIPRDEEGELLPAGREVVINTTGGNLVGAVADLGDGTYTQDLEASLSDSGAEITAIVGDVELATTLFISFVPVDQNESTIAVSPSQTFAGDTGLVTVIPRDDQGAPVGPGFNVVISTTHGELVGSVSDNGDGSYTQTILATDVGTANLTATVDGLLLNTSASMSVLDPANFGEIIGVDADGNYIAYLSIQAAVDNSSNDEVSLIYIAPGNYAETIQIDGLSGLELVGLSAVDPVVVHGFVISSSEDIMIRSLDINAAGGADDAVHLRGGPRTSSGVTIIDCVITGANKQGVHIERGNSNILIQDCAIVDNGRNGIDCHLNGVLYTVIGCLISGNGHNGVSIGRDVEITLIENTIVNNGLADGNGGGRWGINRQRKPHGGTPEQVTLIQNVIEGNNGQTRNGSADENINNYDQIIDATDDQPPYTD